MASWEHLSISGAACCVRSWYLTLLLIHVFVLRAGRCQLGGGLDDLFFCFSITLSFGLFSIWRDFIFMSYLFSGALDMVIFVPLKGLLFHSMLICNIY